MPSSSPLIVAAVPAAAAPDPVPPTSDSRAAAPFDATVRVSRRGGYGSSTSASSADSDSSPRLVRKCSGAVVRYKAAAGASTLEEAQVMTASRKSSKVEETLDLGSYLMLNTLVGRGGFAEVREGLNRATREPVAIKPVPLAQESTELKISLSVAHPNIIKFYALTKVEDIGYLIMERAPYNTLREVRKNYKKRIMDPWKTKYYCEQIADGLMYLHDLQICHRDIKLSNVLVAEHRRVKISDFGLAAYCHDGENEIMFTQSVGTLEYKAPELMREGPYRGPGVDMWALGVLMLFLHTGVKVWTEPVFNEGLLRDIDLGKQRKLINHVTNELVRHCIMQLLRQNPGDRDPASRMLYKLRRDRKSRNPCCACFFRPNKNKFP